jgi:hypothetical protein
LDWLDGQRTDEIHFVLIQSAVAISIQEIPESLDAIVTGPG